MREIEANQGVTLKVYNRDSSIDELAQEAVFLVPYLNDNGEKDGIVLQAGIVPILKLSRRGIYGEGMAILTNDIEGLNCVDNLESQVDAYLNQYNKEENAVSVVVVETEQDLPLGMLSLLVTEKYKQVFREDYAELIEEAKQAAAEEVMKTAYDCDTEEGGRRIKENKTLTVYYAGGEEISRKLAKLTHPGQEPRKMELDWLPDTTQPNTD